MRLPTVLRVVLFLVVLGLSGSCSSGSADPLAGLIDPVAPSGFHKGPAEANGSLSLKEAAQSAPVPPGQVRSFLRGHGYRAGYARVWTAGDSFVTTAVYWLGTDADGAAFVDFVRTAFRDVQGGISEPDLSIPGAVQYQFYVRAGEGAKYQLCHGVVFAVAEYAHLVSGCGTTPPDSAMLERRAQALRARTVELVHGAANGMGPKAGTAMSSPSVTVHTGSAP